VIYLYFSHGKDFYITPLQEKEEQFERTDNEAQESHICRSRGPGTSIVHDSVRKRRASIWTVIREFSGTSQLPGNR
jgi:hypothetical protein